MKYSDWYNQATKEQKEFEDNILKPHRSKLELTGHSGIGYGDHNHPNIENDPHLLYHSDFLNYMKQKNGETICTVTFDK